MLIDFCHHSVGSKIYCDKISCDGYEVTNLISQDVALKRTGFMVERFIKPPVNITVMFPCNISIYRIIIDPVIGQQQSCDLKLFTASSPVLNSWLYKTDQPGFSSTDGMLFSFVGSVSQKEPGTVCFENPAFKERNVWRKDDCAEGSYLSSKQKLAHRKLSALAEVSHLSCTILKAKDGKTVAIRKMEIWGSPSHKVPAVLQNILRSTYIQAVYPPKQDASTEVQEGNKSNAQNSTISMEEPPCVVVCEGLDVPEDFVDQITYDIMSVPMLLPCGKNVDLSTLERFINTEASWGRVPSDPFTGLVFTADRKAITNAPLKARIDQFVMDNSDKLKTVARTLASSGDGQSNRLKPSSLIGLQDDLCSLNAREKSGQNASSNPVGSYMQINSYSCNSYFNTTTPSKRRMEIQQEENRKKQRQNSITKSCEFICFSSQKKKTSTNVSSTTTSGELLSHGAQLSQSLDDALAATLNSLPCYTSFRKPDNTTKEGLTESCYCCDCKIDCKTSAIIKYKLKCEHFVCRDCLQKSKGRIACSTCDRIFNSDEVVRVFN